MTIEFQKPDATEIPIPDIGVATENPRSNETVDAVAIETLADSIAVIGVLTPLIAYEEDGEYFVTAGGRRLRAAYSLIERGVWTDKSTLPVKVFDKDAAITAGHTEQLTHQIMSDLDTIKVFAHPNYSEMSDGDLAKLVGRSKAYVAQRRKILSIPDNGIEALFNGSITVDQAVGLTYWVDDEEGFNDQLEHCLNGRGPTGNQIRMAFQRVSTTWDNNKYSQHTTVEDYKAAGGELQDDLFSDEAFVLHPTVLEALARKVVAAKVTADNPLALHCVNVEDVDYSTHRGVNSLTEEEEAEFDDLEYDFSKWRDLEEQREEVKAEDDDELLTRFERFAELLPKSEYTIPDDLAKLLIVGWKISPWNGDVSTYPIIPNDDPEAMEALYESGYLDRPAEVLESENDSEAPETPEAGLSYSLKERIKRIKAHCVRMELIKTPNKVYEDFLVHIAVPTYSHAYFTYRPEHASLLNDTDPTPFTSKAWDKAMSMDSMDEQTLRDLKPADQRLVLAMRVLNCLSIGRLPIEVTAKMVHDYIDLDAKFFKAYKKVGMLALLEDMGENVTPIGSMKAGALAEMLAEKFASQPDWLPTGF